jgi:excisionase family DNA binding protein
MNERDGSAAETVVKPPIWLAPIARLLLTPPEAAAALGISPRLLWQLTKDGHIPAVRLGKAVRYSPAALQQWISDRASVVEKS